jgi:putative DNA base modification enzyme with NMAD domain
MAGAGAFERLRPELILTQQEPYFGRSTWQMPSCFEPRGRSTFSRHRAERWSPNGSTVQLRTVPIGQEFVLDLEAYPDVKDWLRGLFRG